MSYINVGVRAPHNASKKAMKEALKEDPSKVHFYSTAGLFPPTFDGSGAEIPEQHTLSVVGPHPERKRSWYATVTRQGEVVKVT